MVLDINGIAIGSTKEDKKQRKQFIIDFYGKWIIANPTKRLYSKSLEAFIEVRSRFSKIFIMGYEKTSFGKIKLTVGELRGSGQKIQYCITAIENG